jgi:hypothetical protein
MPKKSPSGTKPANVGGARETSVPTATSFAKLVEMFKANGLIYGSSVGSLPVGNGIVPAKKVK